jgi:hypothetical protein
MALQPVLEPCPLLYWCFLITHNYTHGRTLPDKRSASCRGLYSHRTTQQTNIHAPSGIWTRDPSNQAVADLRLRPRANGTGLHRISFLLFSFSFPSCSSFSSSASSSVALQSLQGPLPPHTGGFVILLGHSIWPLWTSDQPVAKGSTCTGQRNTETQRQISVPRAGIKPTIPVIKRKTYALYISFTT